MGDEFDSLEDKQLLTPDDGFRLVVRLMRRYFERQQHTLNHLQQAYTPYTYSSVRLPNVDRDQQQG